jgi:hypothetical protein
MNYYYLNEVPIFTYAMVGITTVVLAAASIQENLEEPVKQEPNVLSTLRSLSPIATTTSNPSTQGGKKRKTKKLTSRTPAF